MAIENIKMPQLGESVTEGTIEKWLVQPGDHVNKYDPLAEVNTDKVTAEVPSSFTGTIKELIASEGETLAVGEIVCTIETEGGSSEEEIVEEAIPFAMVESKPSFMGGGQNEFSKWVGKNLVYPEIAKENGVQGKVILSFTLTAEGQVTNVKVVRGIDPALDKEAVRVVNSSPRWEPGKQRDRAVKVQFIFPVHFQLR